MKAITILTTIALGALVLVTLNNATSTRSLWPLSVVAAAGLLALGIAHASGPSAS